MVVFVLWDDHIYDAWVAKANELKFTQFDPESTTLENLFKPSIDNDEKQTTKNSNANDNEQRSPTTFNPHVHDYSTSNKTETTSEDTPQHLLERLPSVPHEPYDTQRTEDMDQSDNLVDVKPHLHTQATYVLRISIFYLRLLKYFIHNNAV